MISLISIAFFGVDGVPLNDWLRDPAHLAVLSVALFGLGCLILILTLVPWLTDWLRERDVSPPTVTPLGPTVPDLQPILEAIQERLAELERKTPPSVSPDPDTPEEWSLLGDLPGSLVVVSRGRIRCASRGFASRVGLEVDDLVDRPVKDFVAAEDLLRVLDRLEALERGEVSRCEVPFRLRAAGGRGPRDLSLAGLRVPYRGGHLVLFSAEESRPPEATTAPEPHEVSPLDLLDRAGVGLAVISGQGSGERVAYINESFLPVLGGSLPDWREARAEDFWNRLRAFGSGEAGRPAEGPGGFSWAGDFLVPSPDRPGRQFRIRAFPVRVGSHGDRRGYLVTAQVASAGALEETIPSSDRSPGISDILAEVSHELQTPLVSVKGYTEMILKGKLGPVTPEQERGLQVSLRNIDRLIDRIDELLASRTTEPVEEGMVFEDFPLWEVIDEAMEMVQEKIRPKGVTMTTSYETENLIVRGEREKVQQVFTNLLHNAAKFNREGGTVKVTVRTREPGFLEVEIRDTGIGIPRSALPRIFERYYRVPGMPTSMEGTGLGLSIVKEILDRHGGTIRVESELSVGTTFTLSLPRPATSSPGTPVTRIRDFGPGSANSRGGRGTEET